MYDDDSFVLVWIDVLGFVLFVVLMVLAIGADNEDYKFEKHCEQTLDGHVEGNLCVDNDKILDRQ